MPILVRRRGERWDRANDLEFADEAQLQKMLYEAPELISAHDEVPAILIREAGLPGSGQTDLLGVDADGNVLIVETKLAKNSEIRRSNWARFWNMQLICGDSLMTTLTIFS
jgi:RecB family endonuclease NucS